MATSRFSYKIATEHRSAMRAHCCRYQDWHRATTREIGRAQRGCWSDIKQRTAPQRERSNKGIQSTAFARQNYHRDQSQSTTHFCFSMHGPRSPSIAPATKTDLRLHLSFWPTRANAAATCTKYCPCHADQKLSKDCLTKQGTLQKWRISWACRMQNVHSSKYGHAGESTPLQ